MARSPIVVIPCNRVEFQGTPAHVVRHQYIRALQDISKCTPLLIPATGKNFDLKSIADKIDGILLTGSYSNISPSRYGASRQFKAAHLDLDRDETTLPLIKAAIKMDIPLFGICRGFQEVNVACGGTLHQYVQKQKGKLDHRYDEELPLLKRYEKLSHRIHSNNGGIFERLGLPSTFKVNSLHQQGVKELGKGLFVEGIAEDGLIEAISLPKKKFFLAVQWHPEGDMHVNPVSVKLFEGFGRALRNK